MANAFLVVLDTKEHSEFRPAENSATDKLYASIYNEAALTLIFN
jgi:hypothetical protein